MKYRLLYFADLADAAGCHAEAFQSDAGGPRELYAELARRHGFKWRPEQLRIAINGDLKDWHCRLGEGDEIAFLPPVSGG